MAGWYERVRWLKSVLLLGGDKVGQIDPVEAAELVALLTHQTPITILNACQ